LEGLLATRAGAEVVGDSEPDMGMEDDMGSTTEIRGTYKGLEELDSEDLTELVEGAKLEESDEVQTIRGTERCNLEVIALSLPSEDSSYSYL
jgi:hypothetical protein